MAFGGNATGLAVSFLGDPQSANIQIPYYNFEQNDNYRRGLMYMRRNEQLAALKAAKYNDMMRDVHRSFANNLIDLSPFTPMGRIAFADENRNLSEILSPDYYNSIQDVARKLYGAANPGQKNTYFTGLNRFDKLDEQIANNFLLRTLNANLPMDVPEVREHAIQLFRTGAPLDEVVASTRQWVLNTSGTKSLEEFLRKRSDPIWSRAWRVATSTPVAKAIGDVWGVTDVNGGYYNEDRENLTSPIKKAISAATSLNLIGMGNPNGWFAKYIGGAAGPRISGLIGKAGGPIGATVAGGLNLYNALGTTSNLDDRKRFLMAELSRGRNMFDPSTEDLFHDAIVNSYALPYQGWVGPGAMTRMAHQLRMFSPKYRAETLNMFTPEERDELLLSSGEYVRDKRGRVVPRVNTVTEELSKGLGKGALYGLALGKLYPAALTVGAGYGTGKAIAKAIDKWGDKNNGVLGDEAFRQLEMDNPHDTSAVYNYLTQGTKATLRNAGRIFRDPARVFHDAIGTVADLTKYGHYIYQHRNDSNKAALPKGYEEYMRNRKKRPDEKGYVKPAKLSTNTKENKTPVVKQGSELSTVQVNNRYPSAGADAALAKAKQAKLSLIPEPNYAHTMAKAFDSFGKSGVNATALFRALKPSNAVDLMFGNGKVYVNDLKRLSQEARQRYVSTPYGFIPAKLSAGLNQDAKAAVIADAVANNVDDFTTKARVPIAVTKAALVALLLGGAYKMYNNKRQRESISNDKEASFYIQQ